MLLFQYKYTSVYWEGTPLIFKRLYKAADPNLKWFWAVEAGSNQPPYCEVVHNKRGPLRFSDRFVTTFEVDGSEKVSIKKPRSCLLELRHKVDRFQCAMQA